MSKGTKVLALMLVILAGVYALAADQTKDYGVGRTRTIELTDATKVGGVELPAGSYKITHVMDGASHVMVFRALEGSKELARVNCKMVDLPKKAERTTQLIQNNGGGRVLSALTFGGEKYTHEF